MTSLFQRIKQRLILAKNACYDAVRFARHARHFQSEMGMAHLLASISVDAHVLERGLALPVPRPGFAALIVTNLINTVNRYIVGGFVRDRSELTAAHGALASYVAYHKSRGEKLPNLEAIQSCITTLATHKVEPVGGTVSIERDQLFEDSQSGLPICARSRHSVRRFSSVPVNHGTIKEAVRLAQTAPSVCNRQCGRVHVFTNPIKVKELLAIQIGNRGFIDVPCLAVVTADLRVFEGTKERNQPYIDGGLFAMQFMNGLHSQRLAACPLNWSVYVERDAALRKAASIPANEVVIMLVAFGHHRETVTYARSARLAVEHVLTIQ